MDANAVAHILLEMMPYTAVAQATIFLMHWWTLHTSARTGNASYVPAALFLMISINSLLGVFMGFYFARTVEPPNIDNLSEWVLLVGFNILPLLVSIAGIYMARWSKRIDEYVISNEGVFGTLAQAMPIIVADQTGTIQHTTPAFDELARAAPGELVGRDLKTIMPQRYRDRHDGGMAHYVRTREARIVGTVVTVEMLRLDDTEVPVYLALNTTDVDGSPWFVAALWEKKPPTVDEAIAAKDARDTRQDTREDGLDQRAVGLDKRGWDMSKESMAQEVMRNDLDDREDAMDEREEELT